MTPEESAIVDAINARRAQNGLPALVVVDALNRAAYAHALDMALNPGIANGDSHLGTDGSYGGDRMLAAGYDWARWREVTGWGFGGNVELMASWWMGSLIHRDTLLARDVTEIGAGHAYNPHTPFGHYWTVNLGQPKNAPPATTYTVHAPVVMSGGAPTLDLLQYLCGNGQAYRVANARGSFEVFQGQREGDRFYQVKAWDDLSQVPYEEFTINSDGTIGRDVDTSPGGGRYYRQFGAPWVKRHMTIGESFTAVKRVQFFFVSDCKPSAANSGNVQDTIKLVAHHRSLTLKTGLTVEDVAELEWVDGGERYFYQRRVGLCQWQRMHGDPNSPAWSAMCEPPRDMPPMQRMKIPCL